VVDGAVHERLRDRIGITLRFDRPDEDHSGLAQRTHGGNGSKTIDSRS
jgi:hypothetical protein